MRTDDLLRAVRAALVGAGLEPVYLRRLSALDRAPEGGAVVRPGALRVTAQYINGSSEVELPIRVIVKRRDASRAMAEAEDAADALSALALDVEGTGVTVSAGADRAQELELSDSDWYVWEADAVASYTIEAKEAMQ